MSIPKDSIKYKIWRENVRRGLKNMSLEKKEKRNDKIRKAMTGENNPNYGKTCSEETKRKRGETVKETWKNMSAERRKIHSDNVKKGYKNMSQEKRKEHSKNLSKVGKGRKTSEKTKKLLSKKSKDAIRNMPKEKREEWNRKVGVANSRKDITKRKIHKTVEDIINKYGKGIGRAKILELILKRLNCSRAPINRICSSLDNIFNELNIDFPKRAIRWKSKEDLGIELCKELYGGGKVKEYYKGIGKPDFVPDDIAKPIIDVKSTTGDIRIEQKDKYENIRKDVRFMVFENKGKTDIPEDKVMYMKEIIKTLSDDKRLVFQEKYERIKGNISLEQLSLYDDKNE